MIFKKGDRVVFNRDFGTRFKGEEGVVIEVVSTKSPYTTTLKLEMDTESTTCGGRFAQPFAYKVDLLEAPTVPEAHTGLIEMVKATSERVGTRNRNAILHSLVEELGELHTEVAIENGTKKREASPDGVVGEAIDVLVVILDLLHLELGEQITSQAFLDRVQSKLNKWEGRA